MLVMLQYISENVGKALKYLQSSSDTAKKILPPKYYPVVINIPTGQIAYLLCKNYCM